MLLPWISPACWLGTSTWSPPKSLAWQKGFRLGSGLILSPLGHLLLVCRLRLLVSVFEVPLVVIVGNLWLVVLLLLLRSSLALSNRIGGSFLILLLGHVLSVFDGHVKSLSLFGVHPFGQPLGCLLWIRVGVEVGGGSEGLGGSRRPVAVHVLG